MCLSKVFHGAENTRELSSPAASKQKHILISFSPLISLAQLSSGTTWAAGQEMVAVEGQVTLLPGMYYTKLCSGQ